MRLLVALGAVSLALATDALACSCLPVDLARDLPGADGAIIGTVLERRAGGADATYLLRVEQVYKGEIDSRLEVGSASDGAACGLELAVGDRVGLLLTRDGDHWRSGLCQQVDPSEFLALLNVPDNQLPPFNWGGIVIGLLILAAGVFFLFRKRKSYNRLR